MKFIFTEEAPALRFPRFFAFQRFFIMPHRAGFSEC
jgi:hypothetical protein